MPHTMVTFRLHRRGVILLVVFCVLLAVLIFVAGYLTASYRHRGAAASAAVPPAPRRPVAGGTAGGAPAPQKNEPKESLTLRVAVLTSEEDAKAQVASLTAQGLKPTIIQMPTSAGVTLHNVCVGSFETRSAANAAAKELQRRLGYLPVVIPAPPPPNL